MFAACYQTVEESTACMHGVVAVPVFHVLQCRRCSNVCASIMPGVFGIVLAAMPVSPVSDIAIMQQLGKMTCEQTAGFKMLCSAAAGPCRVDAQCPWRLHDQCTRRLSVRMVPIVSAVCFTAAADDPQPPESTIWPMSNSRASCAHLHKSFMKAHRVVIDRGLQPGPCNRSM